MRVIPVLIICLCSGLFSLASGAAMGDADSLRHSRSAFADGRYLEAFSLAKEAFDAGTNPPAATLVMARASELGQMSRRRTEQLYLTALELANHKAPVLGHLTLFYLHHGQPDKAARTEAAFRAACRFSCVELKQQISAARQNR